MLILAAAAALSLLPGCGGGSDEGSSAAPPPVAHPEDFPKPAGRTLAQLQKRYGTSGPVLAPSMSALQVGKNRFGFSLFTTLSHLVANPTDCGDDSRGDQNVKHAFPFR